MNRKKGIKIDIHRGPLRQYLNYPPVKSIREKSAGERRQEDMQALWIFVIQNDFYKLETKSINTTRMTFGKGRFKTLHVGISQTAKLRNGVEVLEQKQY